MLTHSPNLDIYSYVKCWLSTHPKRQFAAKDSQIFNWIKALKTMKTLYIKLKLNTDGSIYRGRLNVSNLQSKFFFVRKLGYLINLMELIQNISLLRKIYKYLTEWRLAIYQKDENP